jgi:hypothetical protein
MTPAPIKPPAHNTSEIIRETKLSQKNITERFFMNLLFTDVKVMAALRQDCYIIP